MKKPNFGYNLFFIIILSSIVSVMQYAVPILTIIELVSMSLVLMLECWKISFRTVKRKFTLDIIEFTVVVLLNSSLEKV